MKERIQCYKCGRWYILKFITEIQLASGVLTQNCHPCILKAEIRKEGEEEGVLEEIEMGQILPQEAVDRINTVIWYKIKSLLIKRIDEMIGKDEINFTRFVSGDAFVFTYQLDNLEEYIKILVDSEELIQTSKPE